MKSLLLKDNPNDILRVYQQLGVSCVKKELMILVGLGLSAPLALNLSETTVFADELDAVATTTETDKSLETEHKNVPVVNDHSQDTIAQETTGESLEEVTQEIQEHSESKEAVSELDETQVIERTEKAAEDNDLEHKTDDLIIKTYLEGKSNNKALELYNGTPNTLTLEDYQVELYANGSNDPTNTYQMSGELESGRGYVIGHNQASDELKAYLNDTASVANFNGDDDIVLRKHDKVIDSIGQVGTRNEFGKDKTLVRKSSVQTGNTALHDVFASVEWEVYPVDTFDVLGQRKNKEIKPEEPTVEASALNITPIAEARMKKPGETVRIAGTIVGRLRNTLQLQDETAAISIHPQHVISEQIGDAIEVTGEIGVYNKLIQLQNPTQVKKTGTSSVTPTVISGKDLVVANESKLVTVENVTIADIAASGTNWRNYEAEIDGNKFVVRIENLDIQVAENTTYQSVTGIVQRFNEEFQVVVSAQANLKLAEGSIAQPNSSHESGVIPNSTPIKLSTLTDNGQIFYTTDGSDPTAKSMLFESDILLPDNTETVIKAITIKDGQVSSVATFTYTTFSQQTLQIHDIQGDGHRSPFVGKMVENIEGIVTALYEIRGAVYAHIQTPDERQDDNPYTSEAIVLYLGNKNDKQLELGDLVSVSGRVDEYHIDGYNDKSKTDLPVTQINTQNGKIEVLQKNMPLPDPVRIEQVPDEFISPNGFEQFDPTKYAVDFWEALEAMRVVAEDLRAVSPQAHGDIYTVPQSRPAETVNGGVRLANGKPNANLIPLRAHPNNKARNFNVLTGDQFNGQVEGVVMYDYGRYKVYTDLADLKAIHQPANHDPATTKIEPAEDKLTIASYNLENFSAEKTSEEKTNRLAEALGKVMKAPDIIGLTEVQDFDGTGSGGPEAQRSYERLIGKIKEVSGVTYKYVQIDPLFNADGGAPNANIRTGFLYRPDRVTFVDQIPHGDATTAVTYHEGQLTLNPGRIEPSHPSLRNSRKPLVAQFEFKGQQIITMINHWNSKRGDDGHFGQKFPVELGSEPQRVEIAKLVAKFIADVKAQNPKANIVSMGDFNDFEFSKPLKVHEGEHMTNMVHHVPEKERYSYVYQGNSQVLDHILVSNHLVDRTKVDMLKVNADFTDKSGRASDHDPIMVQIDFSQSSVEEGSDQGEVESQGEQDRQTENQYAGEYTFEVTINGQVLTEVLTFASRDKALDFVRVIDRLYWAAGYRLLEQDNGLPESRHITLSFGEVKNSAEELVPEKQLNSQSESHPESEQLNEEGSTEEESAELDQSHEETPIESELETVPEDNQDEIQKVEANFVFTLSDGTTHRGSLGEFNNLERAERRIRLFANEMNYTLQNFRIDDGVFLADIVFTRNSPEESNVEEALENSQENTKPEIHQLVEVEDTTQLTSVERYRITVQERAQRELAIQALETLTNEQQRIFSQQLQAEETVTAFDRILIEAKEVAKNNQIEQPDAASSIWAMGLIGITSIVGAAKKKD
ncbi:hypothetical protein FE332_08340 [Dolosigranulum pigrum]|nr:hypothetical protein FE332_08340 [Dolosigranulum pigrum]